MPFLKWHTFNFLGAECVTMATKLLEKRRSAMYTSSVAENKLENLHYKIFIVYLETNYENQVK